MKDVLFDRLWNFIERRSKIILLVVSLLSLFFLSLVPSLSFETDIRGFVPDNEMSRANRRVVDRFGETPRIHFILVEGTNPSRNVLTPSSLKEQYQLIDELDDLEGVRETLSAADLINILCKYELDLVEGDATYNASQGLDAADLERVQGRLELLFDVLNGRYAELLNSMDLDMNVLSNNSVKTMGGLLGLIFSEDFSLKDPRANSTLIIIELDGSLSNRELKELTGRIYDTSAEMDPELVNVELRHTGEYRIAAEVDAATRESLGVVGGAILLVIGAMLFLSFRRLSYVALPLTILILATVWTYGTAYLLGLKFNAMMAGVIPLIFGLGVDYPVHVSERYQEELAKGANIKDALSVAMRQVGGAIIICAVSTAIGFSANVISDVGAVRVFGITCAIGTAYAFLLTLFIYFPARLLLDEKKDDPLLPRKRKKAMRAGKIGRAGGTNWKKRAKGYGRPRISMGAKGAKGMKGTKGMKGFGRPKKYKGSKRAGGWKRRWKSGAKKEDHSFVSTLSYRFPALVLAAAVILTSASVVGAFNLESEFDIKDFLPPDWESIRTETDIFREFEAGSYTLSFILIEGDDVATAETYGNMYLTLRNMEDDANVVKTTPPNSTDGKTILLTESLPQLARLVDGIDPEVLREANIRPDGSPKPTCTDANVKEYYDFLYSNDTVIDPLTNSTLARHTRSLLHRNAKGDYDAAVIRIFVNARTSRESLVLYRELKEDVPGNATSAYSVTGGMILNVATLVSLQEGQIKGTLACIAVIGLILIIVYRRVGLGLISLIPVIISMTWILGVMFALGMDINVLTVTVTSLGIGMGIDYAVHVSERFKRELKSYDVKKAVRRTIGNLWRPLSISSMTTIAGFCVLILTPIPVMAQYGILCALSLAFSYTAATFVLPVFLVKWAKWKR